MKLDYDLDNVAEQQAVPAGVYDLVITGAENRESGPNSKHPGAPMIRVSIAFKDLNLNAPNISHFISLPFGDDDENASFKLLQLKRFITLFGIPYENGMDSDDLLMQMSGQEARAQVNLSEPDDNGNVYNRLSVPRLPNEGEGRGRPPRS